VDELRRMLAFALKMASAMFVEMLANFQHSKWLILQAEVVHLTPAAQT
jgi:hypothetical protein